VITGAVVFAVTIIDIVSESELPLLSKTLYTKLYVPAKEVSTVPEEVIEEVILLPIASVAVAPGSVKTSPTSRLIVEDPIGEITGNKKNSSDNIPTGSGSLLHEMKTINIKRSSFLIILIYNLLI
tara:strand:- start:6 stop:380 length:375 start_codon:yes stop_codon:yes gene_type:complete